MKSNASKKTEQEEEKTELISVFYFITNTRFSEQRNPV